MGMGTQRECVDSLGCWLILCQFQRPIINNHNMKKNWCYNFFSCLSVQIGDMFFNFLQRLLRVIFSYLEVSDYPNEEARLEILDTLHTTMVYAWPRYGTVWYFDNPDTYTLSDQTRSLNYFSYLVLRPVQPLAFPSCSCALSLECISFWQFVTKDIGHFKTVVKTRFLI